MYLFQISYKCICSLTNNFSSATQDHCDCKFGSIAEENIQEKQPLIVFDHWFLNNIPSKNVLRGPTRVWSYRWPSPNTDFEFRVPFIHSLWEIAVFDCVCQNTQTLGFSLFLL